MDLLEAALGARANAHAPYSGFKVGAALRCADGSVFAGCNVENVAYPQGAMVSGPSATTSTSTMTVWPAATMAEMAPASAQVPCG